VAAICKASTCDYVGSTATYVYAALSTRPTNLTHTTTTMTAPSGPALVVGSLGTAQDGRYQNLITELAQSEDLRSLGSGAVERQILDRILDGGELFSFGYQSKANN
jgi:hypothetical protein